MSIPALLRASAVFVVLASLTACGDGGAAPELIDEPIGGALSDSARCGDGLTEPPEACDDNGRLGGDGCAIDCSVEPGWQCAGSPSICDEICGDGVLTPGEACDDGNSSGGDGCDSFCAVEAGFICSGQPSVCNGSCGDGVLTLGEACDDGNSTGGDGCDSFCAVEAGFICSGQPSVCNGSCGDGVPTPGEACDDGNTSGGDGCNSFCAVEAGFVCSGQPSVCNGSCGDGVLTPGEACDDGNSTGGDGCDSFCAVEAGFICSGQPSVCNGSCGDGVPTPGEACDDGNSVGGDGCDSFCAVEPGYVCGGVPSLCTATCGDGIVSASEACDDGATSSGDGCSSTCSVEAGFVCNGEPSVCGPVTPCGNGSLDTGEACDDGGSASGDGCSDTCAVESGWTCNGQPSACACTAVAAGDIEIDPTTRYQTMTGWEATSQAGELSAGFPGWQDELFDRVVNELGITRLRLEIKSGAEHTDPSWQDLQDGTINGSAWNQVRYQTVNDNSDPNDLDMSGFHWDEIDHNIENVVLPLKALIEANGEALHLNLLYTNFDETSPDHSPANHDHDSVGEYGEFILATFLHLESKYSLVPDSLEIILEPDNTDTWDDGQVIGEDIVEAVGRLTANGFDPRIIAPSAADMFDAWAYFDDMSPAAVALTDVLSYHRYQGQPEPSNLTNIRDRALANGLDTAMLEYGRRDSTYLDLHEDLSIGRVSAWQQFTLAFQNSNGDNGEQYYWIDGSNNLVFGSRAKLLRQYFLFVRPGAFRLGGTSGVGALDPLVFINPDGRYAVVVKATSAQSFDIGGLPPATYGIKYTTDDGTGKAAAYDVDLPNQSLACGDSLSTSIPAAGVITIFEQ